MIALLLLIIDFSQVSGQFDPTLDLYMPFDEGTSPIDTVALGRLANYPRSVAGNAALSQTESEKGSGSLYLPQYATALMMRDLSLFSARGGTFNK